MKGLIKAELAILAFHNIYLKDTMGDAYSSETPDLTFSIFTESSHVSNLSIFQLLWSFHLANALVLLFN